jgi:hypothetical protein
MEMVQAKPHGKGVLFSISEARNGKFRVFRGFSEARNGKFSSFSRFSQVFRGFPGIFEVSQIPVTPIPDLIPEPQKPEKYPKICPKTQKIGPKTRKNPKNRPKNPKNSPKNPKKPKK